MNKSPRKSDGTHLIVEYSACDQGILDDEFLIEALLVKAAESIGATVVERVLHRFRPNGVTGCIISGDSHVTIHTWPEAGYASVDLYTSRDCDPQLAHAVLKDGLSSQESQSLQVDRGLASDEKIRVRGHRRVASYTLDCCGDRMPDSIHVGRSPGRGFGLFASRDFEVGELIYDTPGTMAEWDAEFIVKHDAGRSVHNADSLGYELSPELIQAWPPSLREKIVQHLKLDNESPQMIFLSLTNNYQREVLITKFDGLKNHAYDANTELVWAGATVKFDDDDESLFSIPTQACKPIKKGDELFVDYCQTLADFVPPADWLQ